MIQSKIHGSHANVFHYDDIIEYLNQLVTENKNRYRINYLDFAKQSGFGSAALLSLVLNRKRKLSYQAAQKIIQAAKLKGDKKKYFLMLHKLHQSKSERDRAETREEIFKNKNRPQHSQLKLEQYRFLSTWYYPVLYILAGLKNTQWDLDWLSQKFEHTIPQQKIAEALEDLVHLQILVKKGDQYIRNIENPSTGEDFRSLAIFRYHEQMIELSKKALEKPLEEREFNGATLAVPKSELRKIKEKIRNFRKEINDYLDDLEPFATDVYQLNIQFFALTNSIEEKKNALH